ncbi:flagellar hook-associated protein FlgK [Chromatocurvus halotolerans]|uniref:Flagellar hook-associated protein 1 n=1 Tax=Chromatocurvus halotolerans TaxID=1132028 RepID=A0A4R2KS99_9GAMM|nr:flagellar hook-associated protein FlgK [Chromatocurvus halotolerans]TCO76614.1 flagellar hook-associated protein 1 FlgK [Chromatocurvus halotolerans]
MVDFLNTSLSGLQAAQRALATTSNNIANAATEGYSRQRVDFGTRPAQFTGGGFLGTGVQVNDVRRVYDAFLGEEVRSGTTGESRLTVFSELSGRVGDLLGSGSGGLSQGLQSFFDSLQSLANDPASTPVRQTLLSEADSLTRRIGTIDGQLVSISSEVSGRIDNSVATINSLAQAIADTNDQIASAPGAANGDFSSDLLDQRDRLLQQLSSEVEVSVVPAAMGTANVFIGNGQTLVLGNDAITLSSGAGAFGPALRDVSVGGSVVTGQLSGGALGGLLDFQREVLDPARNDLGRTAVGLAESFNAQHSQGFDLEGNFGDDFFAVGGPRVFAANGNSGTASVDASIDSAGALTGNDYQLQFDGSNYSLVNTSSGQPVALSGSGTAADPLRADGVSIVVGGTAAAGDRFAIQPTRQSAAGFARLVDDTDEIAAAFPIRTAASLNNVSDASISGGEILDVSDPDLLTPVTIRFVDSNTFQINGAGAFAYTSGDDIELNGYQLQIAGGPVADDEFTVSPNTQGVGDNRNAQALAALRDTGVLENEQRSVVQQADVLLASVGNATAAAQTALESQSALLRSSEAALQSVTGVNLEEEAANLIRFQQAYEANARVIQIANSTFQSLLAAFR